MAEEHIWESNSSGEKDTDEYLVTEKETAGPSEPDLREEAEHEGEEDVGARMKDLNDKYVRCYADFENYRKRVNREKEELVKFGNESLIYELLPALDSLELALKHTSGDSDSGVVQGVEMTLKEMLRTLEKFGLSKIEATDKKFDPTVHHAMINVEREDMDEKMVVEEMRSGYMLHDKVLRPALVSVSAKPKKEGNQGEPISSTEDTEIKIHKNFEEE